MTTINKYSIYTLFFILFLLASTVNAQKHTLDSIQTFSELDTISLNNESSVLSYWSKVEAIDNQLPFDQSIQLYKKAFDALILIKQLETEKDIEVLNNPQGLLQTNKNYYRWMIILSLIIIALIVYSFFQIRIRNKHYVTNLENAKLIEQQTNKLKLINTQNSKFYLNVSHELKTPLSIIRGMAKQLLTKSNLNPDEKEQINVIIRNSAHLLSSFKQLIEISRSEKSPTKLNLKAFNLNDMIQSLLTDYIFLAKEKGLEFNIENKENENLIYTDLYKLQTIIRNLVSNSIKYTNSENGAINLNYVYDTQNQEYHIQIHDTGRGISENDIEHIFDRQYQSKTDKPEGGFGIGLAICKDYISLLSGKISVKSLKNVGTTFNISIPKGNVMRSEALFQFPSTSTLLGTSKVADDSPALGNGTTHKKIILIVEDNQDFRKYLNDILKEDFQLAFAISGKKAITFLEKVIPDLMIIDWMMPEMDGLELIEILKKSETFSNIPSLMLTARDLNSDKYKVLEAGVDDYLNKDFEEGVLEERIYKLLAFYTNKKNLPEFSLTNIELERKGLNDKIFNRKHQDWLKEVEHYIIISISDFNLDISSIASQVNLSERQFARKIKSITGFTPKKYIQELRFWEARRLLEIKACDSVKEVSYTVGFRDSKHFSRKFKERFGEYPSDSLTK